MGDPYADLDGLVREIDKALGILRKIKARQVWRVEHRQLLRATALSWFRGRRASVAQNVPSDVIEVIDAPYRTILNATERRSSKNTYVRAAKLAKKAVVESRARALAPQPLTRTADSAPSFAPLAADPAMRSVLDRRWEECRRCVEAGAPLAATVMMGGLLEALLVARANRLSDKSKLFKANATPVDPKTGKALDLRQWMLGVYIDVGYELRWISNAAKNVAVILRDYRNYIHPEKERSHGVTLLVDDAAMFWEVTKTLTRELLSMKGDT